MLEDCVSLLHSAATPRSDFPDGVGNDRRLTVIQRLDSSVEAGYLGSEDRAEIIADFDRSLDYQADHPPCEIDEQMGAAMSLANDMSTEELTRLSRLLQKPMRKRLATYSVRCASVGRSKRQVVDCQNGLMALVLNECIGETDIDGRDLMVSLAPLHIAAERTKLGARRLFDNYSEKVAPNLQALWKRFGARKDITASAFGWSFSRRRTRISTFESIRWFVWQDL